MSAEKLKTDVRQEQIVEAILALIANRGVRGLSVAAVARRVGLVPSALYRHFKNKDEMLDAALAYFKARLASNFRTVMKESPDAIERLRLLLMRQVRMMRENQLLALPRILFSDSLYGGHPKRKARIYAMIQENLERFGELLRRGQKLGRVRSDIDPATLSRLFLAMIHSSAILWFMSEGRFDVTKHAEKAWNAFERLIEK